MATPQKAIPKAAACKVDEALMEASEIQHEILAAIKKPNGPNREDLLQLTTAIALRTNAIISSLRSIRQ